jgi:hypothetical protein
MTEKGTSVTSWRRKKQENSPKKGITQEYWPKRGKT